PVPWGGRSWNHPFDRLEPDLGQNHRDSCGDALQQSARDHRRRLSRNRRHGYPWRSNRPWGQGGSQELSDLCDASRNGQLHSPHSLVWNLVHVDISNWPARRSAVGTYLTAGRGWMAGTVVAKIASRFALRGG